MGCDDVKRVIYFFLDGSLGEQKKTAVEKHFSDCPDCGRRVGISRRIRQFFRSRVGRMSAPERFKIRLSRSLRAFRAEI
jgi:anti-sigma factor (TIGR02949 family)